MGDVGLEERPFSAGFRGDRDLRDGGSRRPFRTETGSVVEVLCMGCVGDEDIGMSEDE